MGKNKTAKCIINEYIAHHTLTNTYNIDNNSKLPKINDNDMYNLIFNNYDIITKYNYTCEQLKIIAKRHKINSNGNKKQLIIRIYCFLYISFFIIKIQRCFRGNLVRLSHKLRGPAIMDRNMCINKQDFLNMDDLTTITYSQFFSYKDHDNFIYGFDIISLYNLISKSDKFIQNPYNRNKIPYKTISNLKQLLKINSILNIPIITDVLNNDIPFTKSLNFKIIELFQNINSLGQYSDPNWFLTLSRIKLITFLRYLTDIWNYRAQISQETKNNICPPNGDIFRNINLYNIQNETNIDNIRQSIVDILCNLINRGINNDSRVLGGYYILGALTMVNQTAALSLPWLYQSFSFI
jgi:hypothetical protein